MIFRKTMKDIKKDKETIVVNKKKLRISGEENWSLEEEERVIDWNTYYRRNFHRFAEEYLGLKLHLFQKIMLYLMGVNNVIVWAASRAVGKTWLTAVYCVVHAILYPGVNIVIASAKISQAGLIISEKIIKELMPNFPMVSREIKDYKCNANEYVVRFHNNSTISVVPSLDTSRGIRSNVIILEEFRLIKKDIVDTVIIPFNITRNAPYRGIQEYKKVITDRSKKIYISSAYWKSSWMWGQIKNAVTDMCNGKKTIMVANDMFTSLIHRIKTYEEIFGEKTGMDESTFSMEYENLMLGEGEDSYFKMDSMESLRTITDSFQPFTMEELAGKKHTDHEYCHKNRVDNEIRILSIDVALKGGKKNDNTIISAIDSIPSKKGYDRYVDYIEHINGQRLELQSIRIKSLYKQYSGDYVVLDISGIGSALLEELGKIQKCPFTGQTLEAWKVVPYDKNLLCVSKDVYSELSNRSIHNDALPIIYPIQGSRSLNSEIAINLSTQIRDSKINFLKDENYVNTAIFTSSKFRSGKTKDKNTYLKPYAETTEFMNETTGLVMDIADGLIILKERSGMRKDRYVSIGYGNYFISQKESQMLKGTSGTMGVKEFKKATQKNKNNKKVLNRNKKISFGGKFNEFRNKYR